MLVTGTKRCSAGKSTFVVKSIVLTPKSDREEYKRILEEKCKIMLQVQRGLKLSSKDR